MTSTGKTTKSRRKPAKGTRRKGKARKKRRNRHIGWWIFLVAALSLMAFAFVWRCSKHSRPIPAGASFDGLDVSHYQGEIDWTTVAANEGIKFVYVKATEGASVMDKHFAENVWQARESGLHVGAYHLYTANSSPEAQFECFLKYTRGSDFDLIPCIDVEEKVSRTNLKANVLRLIELMESHYGSKPLLYVNARVYNDYLYPEASACELWIPNYSRKPSFKGDSRPFIWQYTESGTLLGIEGDVDLDCLVNGMTVDRLKRK